MKRGLHSPYEKAGDLQYAFFREEKNTNGSPTKAKVYFLIRFTRESRHRRNSSSTMRHSRPGTVRCAQ
jgi:hypothetical protein